MSIWSSRISIGEDQDYRPDGHVRHFGSSHSYPPSDWVPAGIDLAEIPRWCVPGHEGEDSFDGPTAIGPWLRLDVDPYTDASIVVDEVAVRQLRDQLTDWLNADKVYPVAPEVESVPLFGGEGT